MQNQNIPIRVIVRNTDRQAGKRKTRISFFFFFFLHFILFKGQILKKKKKKKRKEKDDERWLLAEMLTKIFKNSRSVWCIMKNHQILSAAKSDCMTLRDQGPNQRT